jgi:hypothetical protein
VIGKPSAALATHLKEEAQERVTANYQKYGKDGLLHLQQAIENAQTLSTGRMKAPADILNNFPLPSIDGIEWIEVKTARARSQVTADTGICLLNDQLQDHVNRDGTVLPYFLQFDRKQSNLC